MKFPFSILQTLGFAVGFAVLVPAAWSQPDDAKFPVWPSAVANDLRQNQKGRLQGIPEAEIPAVRSKFKTMAEYFAAIVAHPATWKTSQDLKAKAPNDGRMALEGDNGVFAELDRFLLEPVLGSNRVGRDQTVYIHEFGAALDAAFSALFTHDEQIVRINAARVYAHFARTGAPAHYPTITKVLANPEAPTELKYYLFQAAAALLAAPDVTELETRKHSGSPEAVGALVKALMDCVTNPAMLLPGFKPESATAEQLAVVGMVRRQAVRALAQVKFVKIPGPDGKTPIYPVYPLVRVAMSDPNLLPAPTPAEVAEAAIGIMNMAPIEYRVNRFVKVNEYNVDVAVEAITQALITFATPRAANSNDRSIPWRNYALRLAEAMFKWRTLFTTDYDPKQPYKFDPAAIPPLFKELYDEAIPKVLARIEKVDSMGRPGVEPVEVGVLRNLLKKMQANPQRKTVLIEGLPETTILFPEPAKK
jgi:hypothetical protein